MERLVILTPALVLFGLVIISFGVYCARCRAGRPPRIPDLEGRTYTDVVGPFVIGYMLWLLQPIERTFVRLRVSPNALTLASLMACAGAGVAIATGMLATAAWLYFLAGLLDILDGRLARVTHRQSRAGAFLDSVADRWGELFVFSGFAWQLHDGPWLLAVMFAVAGSMMVSYTRARGEALGIALDVGTMQRAERIGLVTIGTFVAAVLTAGAGGPRRDLLLGVALLVVAIASTITALRRLIKGYRALDGGEPAPRPARRDRKSVKVPLEPKRRHAA